MSLLDLNDVTINFGGLTAVQSLNLKIEKGETLALIGPNGAGKSTVFNMITGIYPPTKGEILFNNEKINDLKQFQVTKKGIARTFQNIRLFKDLSVLDNVKIGCHAHTKSEILGAFMRFPSVKIEEQKITSEAQKFLKLMQLDHKSDEMAKNLSYGEQRRLEIARALASHPKLLLLDEPVAGMNPQEKVALSKVIGEIKNLGITIFLVEHDMKFVMSISNRVAVLDYGRKIADGTPKEIKKHPEVIAAYLGKGVV
ncbi:ABC transporter ATP-binding protein [Bacillota bacterium LX-D]|nr:ABC transporter ATP-binding protein [Bacillota bacterium LX-D]